MYCVEQSYLKFSSVDDDFFSYKQHFATFYVTCQKPGMDRNYCLIVFIVYMSYSDT